MGLIFYCCFVTLGHCLSYIYIKTKQNQKKGDAGQNYENLGDVAYFVVLLKGNKGKQNGVE